MADYREISQEYAQGGFKAVALLNGGAAVAILTQLSELKDLAQPVLVASSFWAAGITLSALAWIAAFTSTRYVDKHERERVAAHLETSNTWMYAGILVVLLSLALFVAGVICLAMGFHSLHAT